MPNKNSNDKNYELFPNENGTLEEIKKAIKKGSYDVEEQSKYFTNFLMSMLNQYIQENFQSRIDLKDDLYSAAQLHLNIMKTPAATKEIKDKIYKEIFNNFTLYTKRKPFNKAVVDDILDFMVTHKQ